MENTAERQRRYRERLYKAGFKQAYVWVRRKEGKTPEKMNMSEFMKQLKKITDGLRKESLTGLLNLLIKIAKGRAEEVKLREKRQ